MYNKLYSTRLFSTITRKRILLKSCLSISSKAATHLSTLLSSSASPPLGIRVSIRKRGCNGLSFTMNYVLNDENGRKTVIKDEIINVGNGVKVFVDPVAIFNITGTEMDFIEDELKSEFTFNNPKSMGKCGCGESFNI